MALPTGQTSLQTLRAGPNQSTQPTLALAVPAH